MKMIGLVLVLITASSVGFNMAAKLKEQVFQTQLIIDFFRQFMQQISTIKNTPQQCAQQLITTQYYDKSPFLVKFAELIYEKQCFGIALQSTITQNAQMLDKQITDLLCPLIDVIGKTDIDTQSLVMKNVLTQLEYKLKEQRAQSSEKGGLYIKLATFSGLFICIILF